MELSSNHLLLSLFSSQSENKSSQVRKYLKLISPDLIHFPPGSSTCPANRPGPWPTTWPSPTSNSTKLGRTLPSTETLVWWMGLSNWVFSILFERFFSEVSLFYFPRLCRLVSCIYLLVFVAKKTTFPDKSEIFRWHAFRNLCLLFYLPCLALAFLPLNSCKPIRM